MFQKNVMIKNKFMAAAISLVLCLSFLTACASQSTGETSGNTSVIETSSETYTSGNVSVEYESDDLTADWDSAQASTITLNGTSISFDGTGASVEGNKISITEAGTYVISGTLDDGQILVDTKEEETVRLILNGADITCQTSAPIYIVNAKKTVITLAAGTKNSVTDSDSYILDDSESDEPNAVIFSKDDLTVNGSGTLTVNANYNNAIVSKDELKIIDGTLIINSVDDGIIGKDYLAVLNADITVAADGDGIKSTNSEDTTLGFVLIESGTIDITAGADAIQAETSAVISDGNITLSAGGGSANSLSTHTQDMGIRPGFDSSTTTTDTGDDVSDSMKGIKAGVDVTIDGGIITIDTADDAIHSNGSITINDGVFNISSGDDGMHADSTLDINGGNITITQSYESIESANITINDGNIYITASDDGINISGGNDQSSMGGRPGQNTFNATDGDCLTINGGYIVIDADGDGLDSNGSIEMSGGTVIVNGPTSNGNGAIDYNGSFNVTGGFLVAAGSSGMAQAPSTSSTQYSIKINFTSALSAGTMVHIEDEEGNDILTFVPTKTYQSVVLSSPDLQSGSTYTIYTGGTSTGTEADGLYADGTYTGGTEYESFTVSDIVTSVGSDTGFNQGGMTGGRPSGTKSQPTTDNSTSSDDTFTPTTDSEASAMDGTAPMMDGEAPDGGPGGGGPGGGQPPQ